MANIKIVDLAAGSALVGAEIFEGTEDPGGTPVSKKYTADQLKAFTGGAGITRGRFAGMGTAPGTDADHDIDIFAGEVRDDTDSENMASASTLTKQIDAAWTVGNDAGGIDTGSVASTTTYHLWLIKRTDTGVVDAVYSLSATAPNMPANYNKKRRIMSLRTDSSANIIGYEQSGDLFYLDLRVLERNSTAPFPKALFTLGNLPTGVVFRPMLVGLLITGATTARMSLYPPDGSPEFEVIDVTANNRDQAYISDIITDTSARIQLEIAGSTITLGFFIMMGWHDRRGKDD